MLIKSKYQASYRREMLKFITNNPETVLEIGCREGLFIGVLKENYNITDSWGVEPDETVTEKAKKNIDNVICDFFTKETKIPENHFDLIIFNDVLEHVYDPWEMLIKTKSLLKKNGIVIASIPNINNKRVLKKLILNDDFTYKRAGILDVTHIRFFTKKTIQRLFIDTGYEIIKINDIKTRKKKVKYKILNFLTQGRYTALKVSQYGVTAKVKLFLSEP